MTALGTSMAMVWNNLAVMIAWGAIVLGLFVLSVATGFLGLILVFPGVSRSATARPHPSVRAWISWSDRHASARWPEPSPPFSAMRRANAPGRRSSSC